MSIRPEADGEEGSLHVTDRSTIDRLEWEALLAADPRATLFQHPSWNLRYTRHHPRTQARWLEARDGGAMLHGGLPYVRAHRLGLGALVSGVGGTYAGPVAREPGGAAERALLRFFLQWGGPRVVRRELVWGRPEPPAGDLAALREIETAVFEARGGFESFWRGTFPKNRRNECNRSERRGLHVRASRDEDDLRRFLPIYQDQARRWGIQAEPAEYLLEILREEAATLFFAAVLDGDVVGGHLCFHLADELLAWTGTTRRIEGVFPSSLLIKEEMRYTCDQGLGSLNLGSSLGLSGVASYKRLLGATSSRRWLLFREAWPARLARRLRRARPNREGAQ
jgi:CelD/BcsL family acetyltransferase involved in cellulose biosynthesis